MKKIKSLTLSLMYQSADHNNLFIHTDFPNKVKISLKLPCFPGESKSSEYFLMNFIKILVYFRS